MAKFTFTPWAETALYDIWAAITAENPRAADKLFERIMYKVQLAADFPLIGTLRPELSQTARILVEGKYVVIYEPRPDGIKVIAIVHGMRDPENWLQ